MNMKKEQRRALSEPEIAMHHASTIASATLMTIRTCTEYAHTNHPVIGAAAAVSTSALVLSYAGMVIEGERARRRNVK